MSRKKGRNNDEREEKRRYGKENGKNAFAVKKFYEATYIQNSTFDNGKEKNEKKPKRDEQKKREKIMMKGKTKEGMGRKMRKMPSQ